jgi:hypothetical protein
MRFTATVLRSLLFLTAIGCGDNTGVPTSAGIATRDSFAEGLQAADEQDWATADSKLTKAIQGTGLQADDVEQALCARAKARIELEQFDDAETDLLELKSGAGEMDRVYLLECEWALKKGDNVEAKLAFEKARKINKAVKPPSGI